MSKSNLYFMKTMLFIIYSTTIAKFGEFCKPSEKNSDIPTTNNSHENGYISQYTESSMNLIIENNNNIDITDTIPNIANILGPDFVQIYTSINMSEIHDINNLAVIYSESNSSLITKENDYYKARANSSINNPLLNNSNKLNNHDINNKSTVPHFVPASKSIKQSTQIFNNASNPPLDRRVELFDKFNGRLESFVGFDEPERHELDQTDNVIGQNSMPGSWNTHLQQRKAHEDLNNAIDTAKLWEKKDLKIYGFILRILKRK